MVAMSRISMGMAREKNTSDLLQNSASSARNVKVLACLDMLRLYIFLRPETLPFPGDTFCSVCREESMLTKQTAA